MWDLGENLIDHECFGGYRKYTYELIYTSVSFFSFSVMSHLHDMLRRVSSGGG